MKCSLQISFTVTVISALVSSAALKSLSRSADKLNLLDKQGYEVISDAEEILTPMSSDGGENANSKDDNEVNLSTGVSAMSKPEMLLYGRFYILRKKGLLETEGITTNNSSKFMKSENFLLKTYPQQYFEYRTRSRSRSTTIPPPFQTSTISASTEEKVSSRSGFHKNGGIDGGQGRMTKSGADTIFFPGEEESIMSTTSKKYLRQRKDQIISDESQLKSSLQAKIRPSRDQSSSSSTGDTGKSESSPKTVNLSFDNENDYDQMNSEEFVDWAKDNLNVHEISRLLQNQDKDQIMESDTTNTNKEGTATTSSDIQYNSFILVPGLKCPEGERMTHRGTCAPKYVHIPNPNTHSRIRERTNKGNAKRKLAELLKVLKAVEAEVKSAFEEEGRTESSVSDSEPESTTMTVSIIDRDKDDKTI